MKQCSYTCNVCNNIIGEGSSKATDDDVQSDS